MYSCDLPRNMNGVLVCLAVRRCEAIGGTYYLLQPLTYVEIHCNACESVVSVHPYSIFFVYLFIKKKFIFQLGVCEVRAPFLYEGEDLVEVLYPLRYGIVALTTSWCAGIAHFAVRADE